MKKLGILMGILLLSVATFAMNAVDFQKNLTVRKLKNGLTFLIYERHEAPVVSFHTYVNMGSVNERVGITGRLSVSIANSGRLKPSGLEVSFK